MQRHFRRSNVKRCYNSNNQIASKEPPVLSFTDRIGGHSTAVGRVRPSVSILVFERTGLRAWFSLCLCVCVCVGNERSPSEIESQGHKSWVRVSEDGNNARSVGPGDTASPSLASLKQKSPDSHHNTALNIRLSSVSTARRYATIFLSQTSPLARGWERPSPHLIAHLTSPIVESIFYILRWPWPYYYRTISYPLKACYYVHTAPVNNLKTKIDYKVQYWQDNVVFYIACETLEPGQRLHECLYIT